VACASESCAAKKVLLSSGSGVGHWIGRSIQAALNPAIFFFQEAILAFGGMSLNNLNMIIISVSACKYNVI